MAGKVIVETKVAAVERMIMEIKAVKEITETEAAVTAKGSMEKRDRRNLLRAVRLAV